MLDWCTHLADRHQLPMDAATALDERGFAILPGPVLPHATTRLADDYEAAFASARGEDIRVGSTSTRLSDPAGFGRVFDESSSVFHRCSKKACCRLIGAAVQT